MAVRGMSERSVVQAQTDLIWPGNALLDGKNSTIMHDQARFPPSLRLPVLRRTGRRTGGWLDRRQRVWRFLAIWSRFSFFVGWIYMDILGFGWIEVVRGRRGWRRSADVACAAARPSFGQVRGQDRGAAAAQFDWHFPLHAKDRITTAKICQSLLRSYCICPPRHCRNNAERSDFSRKDAETQKKEARDGSDGGGQRGGWIGRQKAQKRPGDPPQPKNGSHRLTQMNTDLSEKSLSPVG